jgi:hypothetical protein
MTLPRLADAPTPTLADFLTTRGELTQTYAAVCAVYWLTVVEDRAEVSSAEVRAAYPVRRPVGTPRLAAPAAVLRRAAAEGLLELVDVAERRPGDLPVGDTDRLASGTERLRVRLTWLGREVVEALPDLRRVGALRGLARAAPGRTRSGVFVVG